MAAIGLAQLRRYPELLARRREIIAMYDAGLADTGVQTLRQAGDDFQSSGHRYLVRVPGFGVEQRNALITKMAEAGVATNVHYKPLPMHTAYKNLGFSIEDYPQAFCMYQNEITLPLHTLLTDEEVSYVLEAVHKALAEVRA